MSMIQSDLLLGQEGGAGYQIERSLRFNGSDSPFLSHSVTSSSNQKCTISFWLKRTTLGGTHYICATHPSDDHMLWINGDRLSSTFAATSSATWSGTSAPVFRDPSAWYHVVIAFDTTKASASDRVRLYVNGNTVSWSTYIGPVQNTTFRWNNTQVIGRYDTTYGSFYLAEFYTIDGQQLTANDFGQFDSNGIWQPKKYTGTFGSGGSYLSFADNSAATATTLGKDTSGSSNNWTPNNLSVTAGAGNDSLTDSPTNYGTDTGAGGEVRGNYCTWNPLSPISTVTLANANLDWSGGTTGLSVVGTFGITSGKWYWELVCPTNASSVLVGVRSGATSSTIALSGNGTVNGIRFDADAGTLDRTTDGTTWTSIATGLTSGPYFPYSILNEGKNVTVSVNFGQRAFSWTAPSGYKALCTQNLPTPTIKDGRTAMDVVLYTGTGSTLTPTSTLGFSPDLVWIKSRSAATDNTLYDSVRGVQSRLESNNQDAQVTSDNGLTAFNSNGFTLGTLAQVNTNTATYTAWCWNESASSGFDIVTYTGNGTAGTTVAHSLGVKPSLMIVKQSSAAGFNWTVYHTSLGATQFLILQSTSSASPQINKWNNTEPTSTVFTLGNGSDTNQNTVTYVGYLWAPVSGYSAFGSYTGNGSSSGPFIFTNFRPRWILIKRTDLAGNWTIIDAARIGYNVDNYPLFPNLSDIEGTQIPLDILSNGFKLRGTDAVVNANTNNATYIYAAFAEHPFALARAR